MTEAQNIKELPKDWKWVKLGEVAKKVSAKATPAYLPFAKFIGMDCIEPHKTAPSFLYDFKDFKSSGNIFSKDQVLYGRMRPYLNKVYRAEFDGVCSGEFIVLQSDSRLSAEFLKLLLHSKKFVGYATSITTGDRPRLTYGEMSEYQILLPPLPTQQAIVSKIEELFSELDKGIENLKLAQQQLKTYRQAVLKWAFEGKLSSTVKRYDADDSHEVLMAAEPKTP